MEKKYIYLRLTFSILIIIEFINHSITQKISIKNYDFYQKAFNRTKVKNFTILDIDKKNIANIGQFLLKKIGNFNYKVFLL
tara:strand:- start:134 stop:376 length:243 start_codon:yes stop_codon:yes gene_type:complete